MTDGPLSSSIVLHHRSASQQQNMLNMPYFLWCNLFNVIDFFLNLNLQKMVPPVFCKHCCKDYKKRGYQFSPFSQKKKSFEKNSYLDTKNNVYDVKFSVRYVKMSTKNIKFPFFVKNADVPLAS